MSACLVLDCVLCGGSIGSIGREEIGILRSGRDVKHGARSNASVC